MPNKYILGGGNVVTLFFFRGMPISKKIQKETLISFCKKPSHSPASYWFEDRCESQFWPVTEGRSAREGF